MARQPVYTNTAEVIHDCTLQWDRRVGQIRVYAPTGRTLLEIIDIPTNEPGSSLQHGTITLSAVDVELPVGRANAGGGSTK